MAYLADTNILLRGVQPEHPMYPDAVRAVETLLLRGETIHYCSQIVREFWNVCTRPLENNGLGMTPAQAKEEVDRLEDALTFTPDDPAVYVEWLRLVETYAVRGVQVHDTNLVAIIACCRHYTLVDVQHRPFSEVYRNNSRTSGRHSARRVGRSRDRSGVAVL